MRGDTTRSRASQKPGKRRRAGGFSLVEVTVALGIITTTLLLLVGLVPTGVQSNADTFDETQASNLASLVVADMRGTPAGAATSPIFGINMTSVRGATLSQQTLAPLFFDAAFDPRATLNAHPNASGAGTHNSLYRVVIGYSKPSSLDVAPIEGTVQVFWPAQLDPYSAATSEADDARRAISGSFGTFFTLPDPDAYEN